METEYTYFLLKLQTYPYDFNTHTHKQTNKQTNKKKKLINKVNTILLIRVITKYVFDSFTLKNEQIFCNFFIMNFFLLYFFYYEFF